MIDFAIAVVLGAVAAALLALAALPLVWRRALLVTRRRLEAELPVSAAEIRAGRDLIRAEAAVALNRAEQRVRHEADRRAGLLADLSRAAEEIRRLDSELDEARNLVDVQAADIERLQSFEAEIDAARDERAAMADEVRAFSRERDTASMAGHERRIDLAALRTRVSVLEDRLGDAAREARELTEAAVERDGQIALQDIELNRRETALSACEMRLVTQDRHVSELQTALDRINREVLDERALLAADSATVREALKRVALDVAREAAARHSDRK